jgi:hypothetical protein
MPNITTANAQAWAETTKLDLPSQLDQELETQLSDEVFGRLGMDKPETPDDTPGILRSVIAMRYVSAYIDKVYAEDDVENRYAMALFARSERLLEGVINGSIGLPDHDRDTGPSSYPTDNEEPAFTMGQIF